MTIYDIEVQKPNGDAYKLDAYKNGRDETTDCGHRGYISAIF